MAASERGPCTPEPPCGDAALRLAVPTRQLADAPLVVRVSGAPVGATVILQLRGWWWSGEVLQATARYVARDGTVDVARDAPVAGYDGVQPDGLLRALAPLRDAEVGACRRRPPSAARPLLRTGLADDVLEVGAWLDVPGAARTRSVTRRTAHDATVATAARCMADDRVTIFAKRQRRHQGLTVIAVPVVARAGAVRAAALLASHGHVVLLPDVAATHLATVTSSLVHAVEQARPSAVPWTTGRTVLLGLDVVPDRRSAVVTRAWSDLLDRLRALRVAPGPAR
jgi:hypothetical protein